MRERFYSTAELARICGVSISTIKRWTDAGLLRCVRTPGGHRKFRLQDVAEAARRLETSMAMPETNAAARYDELSLLLVQQNREALVERVAETLSQGDSPGSCRWLVDLHRHGMAGHRIAGDVLWTALRRIAAPGADEYRSRRALGLAEAAVRHLANQLPPALDESPRALLAQPSGATSTLWLGFALLVLREAGWQVIDLGAHVPLQTLHLGALQESPDLVVFNLASHGAAEQQRLQRQVDTAGAPIWSLRDDPESLSGLAARLEALGRESGSRTLALEPQSEPRQGAEIFPLPRRLS